MGAENARSTPNLDAPRRTGLDAVLAGEAFLVDCERHAVETIHVKQGLAHFHAAECRHIGHGQVKDFFTALQNLYPDRIADRGPELRESRAIDIGPDVAVVAIVSLDVAVDD